MRQKQKENDREQQWRNRAPDTPFTGSLSSKSKPDLQEIAGTLFLAEEGTKEVLICKINTFFVSHPHICDSNRFRGLFNHVHKQWIDLDMNNATQILTPDNSSHLPLITNVTNLPIAGPGTSTTHGIFTPVQPNQPQFTFYYPKMWNHHNNN